MSYVQNCHQLIPYAFFLLLCPKCLASLDYQFPLTRC